MSAPKTWRQRLKKIRTAIVASRSGRKNQAEPNACRARIRVVAGSDHRSTNHSLMVVSRLCHQSRVSGYAKREAHRIAVVRPMNSQNFPLALRCRGRGAFAPTGRRRRRPENLMPAKRTSRRSPMRVSWAAIASLAGDARFAGASAESEVVSSAPRPSVITSSPRAHSATASKVWPRSGRDSSELGPDADPGADPQDGIMSASSRCGA